MKITKVNETQKWFQVETEDFKNMQTLISDYDIPKKFLPYIQDQRERARLDFDPVMGYWLLIFRGIADTRITHFKTVPMAFIFNNQNLVTINLASEVKLKEEITELISLVEIQTLQSNFAVLAQCLLKTIDHYFDVIDRVNDLRADLEELTGYTTKDAIQQLTTLSKDLVYITTACNTNLIAMRQLQLAAEDKNQDLQLKAYEKSFLGDAIVEGKQALEMTQIAEDIVDRVTNAYNNLLNNQLNDTMRFLTIWSIILMIPPIISGFYGMNVKLPFADQPFAWVLTIIWTLILVVILILRFYRNRNL